MPRRSVDVYRFSAKVKSRACLGGMPFMPSACDQAKRGLLANSVCKLLHVMLEDFTCTTQVYSVTELSSA